MDQREQTPAPTALSENDVCAAVSKYLEERGFRARWRKAGQPGYDIDATHEITGQRWIIEAKGATSSFAGSKQHGRPYGQNGAYNGVSQAFWMACHWTSKPALKDANLGMAIPAGKHFDSHSHPIERVCQLLGITIFRVSSDWSVEVIPENAGTTLSQRVERPRGLLDDDE